MKPVLLFLCFLFYHVNSQIVMDLYRQQTPRQAIMNSPNIPEHKIWLDWLKRPYSHYRANDTIPLLRFLDMEYYAKIDVGSPRKSMNVIFDTAWSTTWLISKDCPTRKIGCWFHNKYNHRTSSSYTKNGQSYIAKQGTYNMSGYYSSDLLKATHITINQTFVEMDNIPYWYIFTKADGIIGLGLPKDKYDTYFSNVLSQTNITNPLFSIYLKRHKSSDKSGSIILGKIKKKHIHVTNNVPDKITYVPINAATYLWEFPMDKIFLTVGNKTIPVCDSDCTGLADTSTSSIITTQELLQDINEQIDARPLAFGKYYVDCDTVKKLPFITFIIGGTSFTLHGKNYIRKLSYGPSALCISAFTAATTVSEEKRWILGGAFLEKYYTIYDLGKQQMGFVRAA